MSIRHSFLPAVALSVAFAGAHAADTYQVDAAHSAALFKVKHVGISYTHGRFNDIKGTIVLDAANPAANKVEIIIKAGSVDTFQPKRDAHLANPDFFDAKQFPDLGFTSTSFKKVDESTFEVAGNFLMHGVTKPLTISVTKVGEGATPFKDYRVGFESTFTIKRSDFGMDKLIGAAGDEVVVTFATEAIKQ